MKLTEIMNHFGSDKGNLIGAKHNYTPIYEKWFELNRRDDIVFVEVGIDFGQSLNGWYEYFSSAKLYMIDCADFSHFNKERLVCLQADQSNFKQLCSISEKIQNIDFFIDDGGHCMNHQQNTFGAFFPKMKSKGLFFIEDILTSNWSLDIGHCYGQPLLINKERSNTTINVFKKFQKTGIFESEFLSNDLNNYLTSIIDDVVIYDDDNNEIDIMSNDENKILNNGIILIKRK